MCLYIDAEEHELGDLGEPANYKAALLDPESNKWLNAMNLEMQSMKDSEVWDLVDLPPNGKIVGSKWLFKKKTDMDGVVHTYKARLVAKGYTQTPEINYEETLSSVADIRAIRILIAIATFMTMRFGKWMCFAMKDLGEAAYILGNKIYKGRSWGLIDLCQSAYIEKILKRYHMENSKRGIIPMQDKLRLSKSQGASTPAELKRMQNVPYASVVVSIMYVVRCTRPDVAFALNITSRFQQNPGDLHWTTVKNILKYLRNTKDMFLVYGGVVDWKSARQSIFATSSAEAEYIAAYDASKESIWVRKFISGFGVVLTIEEPITMYCDNTRAMTIANEPGITKDIRAIRILIAIAAFYDNEIWQMDVKIVFLNGYLHEEVYMEHSEVCKTQTFALGDKPHSFFAPEGKPPRRGLNPRHLACGNNLPNVTLGGQSKISKQTSGNNVTFLILYVDDILIMGNNIPTLQDVKSYLGRCFAMKDLGEAADIFLESRSTEIYHGGASTPAALKRMQNVPYASAVVSIMYAARCTRPDVAFALNITSQFQQNPEAEYIAAYDASKEAVWVRKFISGFGIVPTIEEPISMYCDNTGAITIANESGITKGAIHFRTKVHYIRKVIEYGDIKIEKVHTDDNLVDPFTKALAFPKHSEHTKNIGMLSASSLM
nr:hypothetical protein [Tanacetum cinerariifolium]